MDTKDKVYLDFACGVNKKIEDKAMKLVPVYATDFAVLNHAEMSGTRIGAKDTFTTSIGLRSRRLKDLVGCLNVFGNLSETQHHWNQRA